MPQPSAGRSAPKKFENKENGGNRHVREMIREQLDRIIARAELRVDQWSIHAIALAPFGDAARRARNQLGLTLIGLAKLNTCRKEF
jgi:hypothetical protein